MSSDTAESLVPVYNVRSLVKVLTHFKEHWQHESVTYAYYFIARPCNTDYEKEPRINFSI
jgi:hypothetical protein